MKQEIKGIEGLGNTKDIEEIKGNEEKNLKLEGHLKKAKEVKDSLEKLLPDPEGKNVVAVVELTYGILQHLIAYGMQNKHGSHLDAHVGLPKELRRFGENEIADIFEGLDTFRAGRWYGSKGNGEVIKSCLNFIKEIEGWIGL